MMIYIKFTQIFKTTKKFRTYKKKLRKDYDNIVERKKK